MTTSSAPVTGPLGCTGEVEGLKTHISTAFGGVLHRAASNQLERGLDPGGSTRLAGLERLTPGQLRERTARHPVSTPAPEVSPKGRGRHAYDSEPGRRARQEPTSKRPRSYLALLRAAVAAVTKSDSCRYTCFYCESRFKYMGTRSTHMERVHKNQITSSKSKRSSEQAELGHYPDGASTGEDSHHKSVPSVARSRTSEYPGISDGRQKTSRAGVAGVGRGSFEASEPGTSAESPREPARPHRAELLAGKDALAAHGTEDHPASVATTSSDTPTEQMDCSDEAEGLKTHILTAFGGLLDRALSSHLERGLSPGKLLYATTPDAETVKRKAMAALHELAVQRCRCCRGSQSQADQETRFPQVPASGRESAAGVEEGAASGSPPVETDQLTPPKWEIQQVCVKEETPFLHECKMPDDFDTPQDPPSIEEEVLEDPAADSGFSVFIKEDPDLDLGVDATDNKEAATRGYTSDITCTGPAVPDASHLGSGYCEEDAPADDVTTTLTGGAGTLTSAAVVTADSSGCGTESDSRGTTASSAANATGDELLLTGGGSASTANTKPPFSYRMLIAMAIIQSPHRRLTLWEIFTYLVSSFPYFRRHKKVWQNSVRCCLWSYKCFVKVRGERGDDSGRYCSYWTLDPQCEEMFENGKFCCRHVKRPTCRGLEVAVPARRVHSHLSRREHHRRQHDTPYTGPAEYRQLPETGDGTAVSGAEMRLSSPLYISTATSTSAGSSVSEVGSTGRAALESSHSGRGRRDCDTRTWDETKLAEAATVSISASGHTAVGDGCGGTATGSGTGGVDEERLSGDAGSARTVDTKPPICYAKLIAMAIADSPQRRATVTEIYAYIVSHFPYYERNKKVWQKSIRNILSLGRYFVKVAREDGDRKGKCCCFWMLNWKYKDRFASTNFRWKQSPKRPLHRGPKAITAPLAPCDKTVTALHCTSTATPTSTTVSVSGVGSPGKDTHNSFHPRSDRSWDFSASGATPSVSYTPAATVTMTGGGDDCTNSGGTAVCSAAGGATEEERRGDAGSARTANTKPPFCYVMLAAMAIAHSPHRRATQSEICTYIENRFPYFGRKKKVWRSSVRAYLSLGKYFVRVPREDGDHREHYWTLGPQYEDVFNYGSFRDYPCVKRTFCRQCEKQPFLGPWER
ncbi:uncharacterized protein LOC126295256 isoform X2 [Schistocerca gregaria]|uniref:uncharacterized protein LOC126295256 isoform X2 n=1 Tax=Schistocerca gregaria TaxID=7010 RepID=UPI00211F27A9|nr:uncharacterized protein LOC126295256 isoform X2 [Schistocerca gregaria]